jgi:pimeloyl-ACP methyl ester carboxylesterase
MDWKYFSAGAGTSGMLMLPGSLGGCERMAVLLAQAAPARRILVPEYPIANTVEDCLNALDQIMQNEEVSNLVLMGNSFGGLLAQCWLRRHPEKVTHLILSGSGIPEPARARANHRKLRVVSFVPDRILRFLLRIALQMMLRNVSRDREIWKREYSELISKMTHKDLISRYRIAIDFDEHYALQPSDLNQWQGQILILEGSADRIAGKKIREGLRSLYPQAQIHIFQGAGHSAILTHTEEWLNVVSQFIDQ